PWDRTLPRGAYTLTRAHCASTDKPPDYPAVRFRAALFDFDGLGEKRLLLLANTAIETYVAPGCTITVERSVAKNFDGYFSFRMAKRYSFDPVGCRPTVTVGDETVALGPETSPL